MTETRRGPVRALGRVFVTACAMLVLAAGTTGCSTMGKGGLQRELADKEAQLAACLSDRDELQAAVARLRQANDALIAENAELVRQLDAADDDDGGAFRDVEGVDPDDVRRQGSRLIVPISDSVLFASGKADLSAEGRSTLDQIAAILRRDYPGKQVRVEGHTDNVPIGKPETLKRWPTNWELSGGRAVSVLHYLVKSGGIQPDQIGFCGFGEHRPRADNATPDGRRHNRRVEVVVVLE